MAQGSGGSGKRRSLDALFRKFGGSDPGPRNRASADDAAIIQPVGGTRPAAPTARLERVTVTTGDAAGGPGRAPASKRGGPAGRQPSTVVGSSDAEAKPIEEFARFYVTTKPISSR